MGIHKLFYFLKTLDNCNSICYNTIVLYPFGNDNKEEFNMSKNQSKTKTLVMLGLLTAIVVVLQLLGSFIKFGAFSVSLVLIPIVVGSAIYGWKGGGWLGFVFGVTVLISGDAAAFLTVNVIGTIITVLLKGAVAGVCTGLVYDLLKNKNDTLAVAVSAIVCPIVNTGIFILGCLLFFMDTITSWAEGAGYSENLGKYIIVGLVGVNFLLEMGINVILSPAVVRIINIKKKI